MRNGLRLTMPKHNKTPGNCSRAMPQRDLAAAHKSRLMQPDQTPIIFMVRTPNMADNARNRDKAVF